MRVENRVLTALRAVHTAALSLLTHSRQLPRTRMSPAPYPPTTHPYTLELVRVLLSPHVLPVCTRAGQQGRRGARHVARSATTARSLHGTLLLAPVARAPVPLHPA